MTQRRYIAPGVLDRIFNFAIAGMTRLGISLYGSRILAVPGRKSGTFRTVPVNLLEHEGDRYLVAPRGETEWVRNLRASGAGELRLGSGREEFRAIELRDAEKPPILRAYLARWWFEVSRFFDLPDAKASDSELARVAPQHPVFRIEQPQTRQHDTKM
jgi:deazaflavin-dependent oxidoreductase (nitroreductase family)